MTLKSERELTNTRAKLQKLEQMYLEASEDSAEDPSVRALSMQSLQRLINQLKEEIAVFEAHRLVPK